MQSLVYFVVWESNTGSFLHVGKSTAKPHTQPEKKFVLMESHYVTVAALPAFYWIKSACHWSNLDGPSHIVLNFYFFSFRTNPYKIKQEYDPM